MQKKDSFELDVSDVYRARLLKQINIIKDNKIPVDLKGNEADSLRFETNSEEYLNLLLDAMQNNTAFKGSLSILSTKFNDLMGLKVAKIIKNNSLTSLVIWNRSSPFSGRVSTNIGNALIKNTSLKQLTVFLDVNDSSAIHVMKFLRRPESQLEELSYLKVSEKLFIQITNFLNNEHCLKKIHFYYEPLKEVNPLYENQISDEVLNSLSEKIENDSNIIETYIIPLKEHFPEEINEKLSDEIDVICKTLDFSSKIVKRRKNAEIIIEPIFVGQNKVIDAIIQTIDRDEGKKLKNSIVSIRSYLDRVIGESLN